MPPKAIATHAPATQVLVWPLDYGNIKPDGDSGGAEIAATKRLRIVRRHGKNIAESRRRVRRWSWRRDHTTSVDHEHLQLKHDRGADADVARSCTRLLSMLAVSVHLKRKADAKCAGLSRREHG